MPVSRSPARAKCFYLLSLCLRGWLSPWAAAVPRNANGERAAAALRSPWRAIPSGPGPRPRRLCRDRVTPIPTPGPEPSPAPRLPWRHPAPWGSAKIVIPRRPGGPCETGALAGCVAQMIPHRSLGSARGGRAGGEGALGTRCRPPGSGELMFLQPPPDHGSCSSVP